MIDLILIGGGGHCKSCIDVIESNGGYRITGILDLKENAGNEVLGYNIIGTDEDIEHYSDNHQYLITVGQIRSAGIRTRIYEKLSSAGAQLATVIAPSARVSRHATLNPGTIVMHHATINVHAVVGVNCIINTGANVEHDCNIGNHVHISTHAVVNGDCKIGDECFIGSNAVLSNGVSILPGTIIGAGAVIQQSLNNPGIFVGNPGRQLA